MCMCRCHNSGMQLHACAVYRHETKPHDWLLNLLSNESWSEINGWCWVLQFWFIALWKFVCIYTVCDSARNLHMTPPFEVNPPPPNWPYWMLISDTKTVGIVIATRLDFSAEFLGPNIWCVLISSKIITKQYIYNKIYSVTVRLHFLSESPCYTW